MMIPRSRPSLRSKSLSLLASLIGLCSLHSPTHVLATPPATASKISASLERSSLALPNEPVVGGAPATVGKYPWKTNIVGTVFWCGELPTEKNPTPNTASSWDPQWMKTFGGFDDPDISARAAGYRPANFVPQQNPFYVALPYNDCVDYKTTKEEASKVIPWFKEKFVRAGKSVCHNRWLAIRYNGQTCYAQWSDCGPFLTTDANYVFGNARPTTTKNNGAGIDLAPAVRDYLGFRSGKTCDWRFVDESEVPDGPWKDYGTNNPFSLASKANKEMPTLASTKAKTEKTVVGSGKSNGTQNATVSAESARLEELRRQRDLWFSQNSLVNSNRAR
jgi:hypothetical protein